MQKLNEEAEAKKVPVVSRENAAPYRVRGYVALGIEKKQKRTVVSWVLDVYDADLKRSVRLSGEEIAGPAGRNPWDAANDEVLTRVARAGMTSLAAYFQSAGSVGPDAAPESAPRDDGDRNLTVASIPARDDFRPEAQGVFRLSPAQATAETAAPEADIPLPRRRPATASRVENRVAMAPTAL